MPTPKYVERARAVLGALLLAGPAAHGDEVFVDAGACPGEGCVYGERWIAREPVRLHARPDAASDVVETLDRGARVETVTGEVHTRPGRFRVAQARGAFEPGDEIRLYTYLGEGWYRARHRGVVVEVDLGFSPYDRRCRTEGDARCWGVLERAGRRDWWVRVRTAAGLEGWALSGRAFERAAPAPGALQPSAPGS